MRRNGEGEEKKKGEKRRKRTKREGGQKEKEEKRRRRRNGEGGEKKKGKKRRRRRKGEGGHKKKENEEKALMVSEDWSLWSTAITTTIDDRVEKHKERRDGMLITPFGEAK